MIINVTFEKIFFVFMLSFCYFLDSWEESQSTIHMALRDAICRGDINTTRLILSELGSKEEFIVNMAPNGSTTLLYWYKLSILSLCII